jgi:hypothetical protein
MPIVARVTALLLAAVMLLHHEALQGIHRRLGTLAIPSRLKLLVLMAGCFLAHGVEIGPHGLLLIGCSASFLSLSMEAFWTARHGR